MTKVLINGLAAGLVMLIASLAMGWILGAMFPELAAEYQNPAIFRPWSDPWMSYMYVHPFIVGVLLSWVWMKVKGVIKIKDPVKKGAKFGLAFWVVCSIPGMLMTYSSFTLSATMVASWTISTLVQLILAGIVFAYMYKK